MDRTRQAHGPEAVAVAERSESSVRDARRDAVSSGADADGVACEREQQRHAKVGHDAGRLLVSGRIQRITVQRSSTEAAGTYACYAVEKSASYGSIAVHFF